ncbi:hypothetical protein ETB97_007164 [Aspergillus alliaceus]|uniref:Uncharacterized protein n=1 Tax=Petromyces alliaceus TaxID=209559 RepID=A0A8H6ACN6_PETAA|nr:hypothetical protein ETB97_007164 [Aspergillus burnettii]
MTAWFLTEREIKVAHNHTGIENRQYRLYQAKEALLGIQIWILCAQSFLQCILSGGAHTRECTLGPALSDS